MDSFSETKPVFEIIKEDIVQLATTMGLMIKQKRDNLDAAYVHLPVSFFPMPYPLEMFVEACDLQLPFGRALAGIVRDPTQNISAVVSEMRKYDEFLDQLVKVSESFNERRRQGLKV